MSDILNSITSQYEENTKKQSIYNKISNGERLKKYFSTNLPKGVTTGEKQFRILPTPDGSSPFKEQWCHEIQLDGKWVKLHCLKHNDGETCPLCEVEAELRKGTDEEKKTAGNYRARRFYIVKGIDREKEEDGPKFWRFRHNSKKQGTLDKIVPIFTKKGDITNASGKTDSAGMNGGRDLILSLGRDDNNYSKVTTIMYEDPSDLSTDSEKMKAWLEDETTFRDVYSIKTFDYLEVVAEGYVPYWDKEDKKFIPKEEWETKFKNEAETEVTIEDITTETVVEDEVEKEGTVPEVKKTTKKTVKVEEIKVETPEDEIDAEDYDGVDDELDDLPF